jgi:signal peptide peptidase SppA
MLDLKMLTGAAWAMHPEHVDVMLRRLALPLTLEPEKLEAARQALGKKMRQVSGRVAVLSIQGPIEQRMSAMGYYYGGGSTEACEGCLQDLLSSREVEAIVLDIDSPGGTSYGVAELADRIYEARSKKPIYAIANSMAASAAYWIASAASQLVVTPGGDVGSVGVYAMHVDMSKALDDSGIKVTIAKAGKYKAENNPFEPLTQDARDYLQEMVDECYTQFVKAVARNRGVSVQVVREKFGQGRVVSADKAVELGMADKVMSFSQLIEKLTGGGSALPPRGPSMQMLRLRQAHRKAQ